jgi:hypothetical protein
MAIHLIDACPTFKYDGYGADAISLSAQLISWKTKMSIHLLVRGIEQSPDDRLIVRVML